jgi:hypothetical protein
MILVAGGQETWMAGLSVCSAGKATRCAVWHGLKPRNPPWVSLAVVRGDLTEPRTLPPAYEAQTPLLQVTLRWHAGLRAVATPPSVRQATRVTRRPRRSRLVPVRPWST